MKAPSTLLLRAMLRPQQALCQIRSKSDWMPREKYAKITLLDRLHRKQKAAARKQRLEAELRAENMTALPPSQPKFEAPESRPLKEMNPSSEPTLPFLISRTESKNIPVYESVKAGGSKQITSIRKISGDLPALAAAVREGLGLQQYVFDVKGRKKETVSVNWTTRQVVIRGWRGAEIKKWAELSGF